jgi:hypothetical protein
VIFGIARLTAEFVNDRIRRGFYRVADSQADDIDALGFGLVYFFPQLHEKVRGNLSQAFRNLHSLCLLYI